jgi:hypothetical protein
MIEIARAHGVYITLQSHTLTAHAELGHDWLDESDVTGCTPAHIQEIAGLMTERLSQEADND